MDKPFCLICNKPRNSDPRAKYCWTSTAGARGGSAAAASVPTQALPLAALSAEAQEILPLGAPERLLIAIQLALVGMATAGARGYRVGTQHGQSLLMRWFPTVKLRQVPLGPVLSRSPNLSLPSRSCRAGPSGRTSSQAIGCSWQVEHSARAPPPRYTKVHVGGPLRLEPARRVEREVATGDL